METAAVGVAASVDPATNLPDSLERSEARRAAREQGHLFKPPQWGDAFDDNDMLSFDDAQMEHMRNEMAAIFNERASELQESISSAEF